MILRQNITSTTISTMKLNSFDNGVVTIEPSEFITVAADVVGWIYFAAWTGAFYPQIISNCLRKSVVGLNFDFIALNFLGHLTYAVFNGGLYFIHPLQDEYMLQHPGGVIPVQLNDVLFSAHATCGVVVWIVQATLLERENQQVSMACIMLLLLLSAYIYTCLTLTVLSAISWLTFVYYFSYVKLITAVVKYSPQVYLHYKRKSTTGFSMGSVLLDFAGGFFSVLQMILIAWNYEDWGAIFGDPTKLGLGVISMSYCSIFLVQSYFLYKEGGYEPINEEDQPQIHQSIKIEKDRS